MRAALLALSVVACSGDKADPGGEAPPATSPATSPPATSAGPTPPPSGAPLAAELPTPVRPSHRAKTPHPTPSTPDVDRVLEVLKGIVGTHGTEAENPWAVAHAVLALGPDIALDNGQPAVDYLYDRYASVSDVMGHQLPSFPRREGTIRVEPHTDLLLKAFTEADLDPARVVKVKGQDFEMADHWHHSLLTTFLRKTDGSSSYDTPNDMPWGVQGLAAWSPPGMTWTAFDGTAMSMDDLVKLMVHVLTTESAFMIRAMSAGEGFTKQGQGIFKYTCGGAHLLQGSIYGVARGYGGPQEHDKMRLQGQLLFYRLPRELAIYEQARQDHPNRALVLYAQQLKFVGHWLESVHKLMAAGLYEPSPAEQAQLVEAVGVLVDTMVNLKKLGALDNLPTLRQQNEQLYLDIVGDSAHAVRGLELALGRAEFVY